MELNKKKHYLPGLHGLRFFAALAVIVTHVELIKGYYGYENVWNLPVVQSLGPLGVLFFFVLSGFLITYLMLVEHEKTGRISFRNFYVRRVLRIFPLYYFTVLLAFGVFYHIDALRIDYQHRVVDQHFLEYLLFYVGLVPNLSLALYETSLPHFGQLWSIGVEEQFYLLWPFLIWISRKNIIVGISAFFCGIVFVKFSVWLAVYAGVLSFEQSQFWRLFLATEKLESMALGGAGAWMWYHHRDFLLSWLRYPWISLASLALIGLSIYYTPDVLSDGVHIIQSMIFLVVILNVIACRNLQIWLEVDWLKYLGTISFGIYVYHLVIVTSVSYILTLTNLNGWLINLVLYPLSIALTIIVSAISYRYLETPFFALKQKFQTI